MASAASPEDVEDRRVTRLIRLKEVQHRVGLGRSTIYRWMAEGKFPKPVQLGGSTVAWSEREVDRWIANRLSS
jgi:prophage regulatory protein